MSDSNVKKKEDETDSYPFGVYKCECGNIYIWYPDSKKDPAQNFFPKDIKCSCGKSAKNVEKLRIKYSVDLSRVRRKEGSGIYVAFWLAEILLNLRILSDNLFIYYPKRRKIFIERLLAQSTVKYIIGETSRRTPILKELAKRDEYHEVETVQVLNSLSLELETIK